MKVSSIGPFSGPQESDLDREDEIELAEIDSSGDSPVLALDAGGEPSSEGEETRDGLLRLVEYLARRQTRKRRASGNSRVDHALSAYEGLDDQGVEFRGTHYDQKK